MTSYHAWTHRSKALGGTDPLEISSNHEYAYFLKTTNATLNSGAATITFFAHDVAFSSDETCIHCNDDAFYGGTFEILKTGIYVCSFGTQFTTSFAFERRSTISWDTGLFPPHLQPQLSQYESAINSDESSVCGMANIATLISLGSPPGLNTVTPYVQQFSGAAKTINTAGALLVRIQALD